MDWDKILFFYFCSASGGHLVHKDLDYAPPVRRARRSVTAYGNEHIMVAEKNPPAIHVYNLNGEEVHRFTNRDLRVEATELLVGIRYNNADGILHAVYGATEMAQSVCAYKVEIQNN